MQKLRAPQKIICLDLCPSGLLYYIHDFSFLGYLHGLTKIAHRFGNFLLSGKYCLDFLFIIFCLVSRLNLCQDFDTILLQVRLHLISLKMILCNADSNFFLWSRTHVVCWDLLLHSCDLCSLINSVCQFDCNRLKDNFVY